MTARQKPLIAHSSVKPLGFSGLRFFLISADGEPVELTSKDLEAGRGVYTLYAGSEIRGAPAEEWLAACFPPKRARDTDAVLFDEPRAGRWLIDQCKAAGPYDPTGPMRRIGVWRETDDLGRSYAVANVGHSLLTPAGVRPSGGFIGADFYPAAPAQGFPERGQLADLPRSGLDDVREDLRQLVELMRESWNWLRARDVDAWVGHLGAGLLGEFIQWRPHKWVCGEKGTGKTELIRIESRLAGPMARPIEASSTAASMRRKRNGEARMILLDEQEEGVGAVDHRAGILEIFRAISPGPAEFSRAIEGTTSFFLCGAGSMYSIHPAQLLPQDRSRFIRIYLDPLPRRDDLEAVEMELDAIRTLAAKIGKRLWLHAYLRAPAWDAHFRAFRLLVQRLGGSPRDADTIGATLAGEALLLSDRMQPDEQDMRHAEAIARPLVEEAALNDEIDDARSCWRHFLHKVVHFGAGKSWAPAELLDMAHRNGDAGDAGGETYRARLGRIGVRYIPRDDRTGQEAGIVIASGEHAGLCEMVFRNSKWPNGAHADALRGLAGVRPWGSSDTKPNGKTIRINGYPMRALFIPARHMPDLRAEDEDLIEAA